MGINWTEEVITDLSSMWTAGMSSSQIAAKLVNKYRDAFTRSAVIGKIHRLGLTRSPSMNSAARKTAAKKRHERERKATGALAPTRVRKPNSFTVTSPLTGLFVPGRELPRAPIPVEDVPPADLVKFAALTDQQCRWIYGDPKEPSHGYCGKPVVPGLSWCPGHRARVFQPPVVRPRQPQPVRIPTIADLEKV